MINRCAVLLLSLILALPAFSAQHVAVHARHRDEHAEVVKDQRKILEAAAAASELGELSAEQKSQMKLQSGLVVTDVRPDAKAEVRKGDVLVTLVYKGQHVELKSVEQFNKLLAGMDKNAVLTLQVRRGESVAFVTVSGLTDKG